jgi:3-phenylpropionate/cinnamic acid dioxygenase small subunit
MNARPVIVLMSETQGRFSVVLSAAKDLIAACYGHEILRCAQDDIGDEVTSEMGRRTMAERDARIDRLLLGQEIADFLYREAELLDERRYREWLDLLADDIRYWMPMRRNVKFGEDEREFTRADSDINWFDEGKDTLVRRVKQIETGIHWAEEPRSRLSHLVTNVQLQGAEPSFAAPQQVSVTSRFLIYRNRVQTETDILVGRREDSLRRNGAGWLLARRKIILDQNVLLSKNLTFFI